MDCFVSKIMAAFEIFLADEFVTWDKFAKVFSAADNSEGGLSHVNQLCGELATILFSFE